MIQIRKYESTPHKDFARGRCFELDAVSRLPKSVAKGNANNGTKSLCCVVLCSETKQKTSCFITVPEHRASTEYQQVTWVFPNDAGSLHFAKNIMYKEITRDDNKSGGLSFTSYMHATLGCALQQKVTFSSGQAAGSNDSSKYCCRVCSLTFLHFLTPAPVVC